MTYKQGDKVKNERTGEIGKLVRPTPDDDLFPTFPSYLPNRNILKDNGGVAIWPESDLKAVGDE